MARTEVLCNKCKVRGGAAPLGGSSLALTRRRSRVPVAGAPGPRVQRRATRQDRPSLLHQRRGPQVREGVRPCRRLRPRVRALTCMLSFHRLSQAAEEAACGARESKLKRVAQARQNRTAGALTPHGFEARPRHQSGSDLQELTCAQLRLGKVWSNSQYTQRAKHSFCATPQCA